MIKVFILSDVRLYRDGLIACLPLRTSVAVVGAAPYRLEAIHRIRAARPDVVLADLSERANLHVVRAVATTSPRVRIVALSVWEVEQDIVACAAAGVHGYVSHDASVDELLAVVERVAGGEAFCSAETAALARRLSRHRADAQVPGALTYREREIARLIEGGRSNKEIASELSIELATVKNHVHNILEKLRVRRRGEVAAKLRGAPAPRDDERVTSF